MAANNFKPFAIGNNANVTSQADYEALSSLITGFQSGKASSAQINKAIRQSSVMAYVLAQFISDSSATDVLDNGAPDVILANLRAGLTSLTPGRLINVQIFKSSATYNKTAGTKNVIAEVQAAGGSGGNTGYSGSSTVSLATGGSAGGYAKGRYSADQVDGQLITVGTGGKAKVGNPVSGSVGGDSSIGSLITCKGGSGGYGQEQATPPFTCTGVLGGDATGGNIVNTPGGSSEHGVSLSTGSNFVGKGGDSFFGKGGFSRANNNSVGVNATGFGSGGGGAVGGPSNTSTGYKGGDGADGIVIIWEYA